MISLRTSWSSDLYEALAYPSQSLCVTQLIRVLRSLSLTCLLDAEETVKVSSSDLPLGLSHVQGCDHHTAPVRYVQYVHICPRRL